MTSVPTEQLTLSGYDCGPLWRRSAFRSAMSSWRDFALRGFIRALRPMGQVVPDEFLRGRFPVSRELKGEG